MKKQYLYLFLGALPGSLLFSQAQTSPADEDDEVVELSPFVVETTEEMGYLAASTLAGTRIKTDVKDVGAAVSIYTTEFLNDIQGDSLEQVLQFTANTEVAGADGNFSGAFEGENNSQARAEPARTNRLRGLASADLSRNFFLTDIPFDGYNSSELTIVRGPNSILAGAGSPGGLIDGNLRTALFKDATSITLRGGKNGTYRAVLNFNHEVIKDRLAVRVDLLNERQEFRQEPAFNKDRRIHLALQGILSEGQRGGFLGRTAVRANYENGKIEGVPPNPLPPVMSTQGWFSETEAGKWFLNGHNRQRVAGDNAFGAWTPGQVVPAAAAQRPEGWVEGFPLFAQLALLFSDPSSDTATIGLSGALAPVQGISGVGNPGGGFLRGTGDRNRERAGFNRTRLQDRQVFDFYNHLLTGAFDFREQDFDAINLVLEQLFLDGRAGIEFAYDQQDYSLFVDIPIQGGDTEVFIDVNKTLSVRDNNEQPIENPNFSRPFIVSRDAFQDSTSLRERETYRLTGFFKHDFRDQLDGLWSDLLGRHTLSLLFQQTENDRTDETFASSWNRVAGDFDLANSVGNPGTFRSQVNAWFYIGEPTLALDDVSQIRLTPINTVRPEFGDSYTLQVHTGPSRTHQTVTATPERITRSFRQNREEFESYAVAHQAHWLDNHLVTLLSYREDTSNRSIGEFTTDRDTLTTGDLTRDDFVVVDDPELTVESWTKSVVAYFPEKYLFDLPLESELRFFWNQSENFSPVGARRNIFNEDVGPPSGETEDFGFGLTLFNGKLDLRVTWYETRVNNATVGAGGNPYGYLQAMMTRLIDAHNIGADVNDPFFKWDTFGFNNYIEVAEAFFDALPERLNTGAGTQFDPRIIDNGDGSFGFDNDVIPQLASVSDTVSDGVEIEVVYNPLPNWRISLSVAKQEAVKANVGALELEFADEVIANLQDRFGPTFLQGGRNPAVGSELAWIDQYRNEHLFDIRTEAGKSGSLLPELAKWRVNLVTRYTFREGLLKRFRIGGSLRWTDERAVGFPFTFDEAGVRISDVENPYFTSDVLQGDLNVGYQKKINLFGRKVDWTVSLYIRNLISDQDLLVTKINPDGTIGQVRVPPERSWSITNNIRF